MTPLTELNFPELITFAAFGFTFIVLAISIKMSYELKEFQQKGSEQRLKLLRLEQNETIELAKRMIFWGIFYLMSFVISLFGTISRENLEPLISFTQSVIPFISRDKVAFINTAYVLILIPSFLIFIAYLRFFFRTYARDIFGDFGGLSRVKTTPTKQ